MRKALDLLYRGSGALAALCLAMIAVTIVAQVIGRVIGVTIDSTESGGFFLAGTTFLGMAYTLKTGGHVRVSLLVGRLRGRAAWLAEAWISLFGTFACGFASWQTWEMVHDSWRFGDLSPGLLAIPVWIPQSAMLAGLVLLAVAMADELALVLAGRRPGFAAPAETALDAPEPAE
ncbi:TRAP transporter small permease [Poseidonocella sp. HB161398]|uniref:TRAP transporter small permease n=1 Tax=Poseidonocella sp. HB161398 TaxID=2320855 RepID=UPI0011080AE0|nr:TRAP transporter small permease [Poseidonocella sp. HB161398]